MAPPVPEEPSAFIAVFRGQDKGGTEFGAVPGTPEFHFIFVCRECAAILGQLTALALAPPDLFPECPRGWSGEITRSRLLTHI